MATLPAFKVPSSVSLARISMTTLSSSFTVAVSLFATGASFTGVTVTVTVAVLPSPLV